MLQPDNTFIRTFEIGSHIADFNRELLPNQLFNLMQETAVSHSETLGMGWDYLHDRGLFWALSKMDVEIIRMPQWLERIKIITWSKEYHLLVQPRDFFVETEDGELLARATSNWALVDLEGRPHPIEEIKDGLRHRLGCDALEKSATRLRKVTEGEWSEPHAVVYSDLDLNQHVNNTVYISWVMDNFSYAFHQQHRTVSSLSTIWCRPCRMPATASCNRRRNPTISWLPFLKKKKGWSCVGWPPSGRKDQFSCMLLFLDSQNSAPWISSFVGSK